MRTGTIWQRCREISFQVAKNGWTILPRREPTPAIHHHGRDTLSQGLWGSVSQENMTPSVCQEPYGVLAGPDDVGQDRGCLTPTKMGLAL